MKIGRLVRLFCGIKYLNDQLIATGGVILRYVTEHLLVVLDGNFVTDVPQGGGEVVYRKGSSIQLSCVRLHFSQ